MIQHIEHPLQPIYDCQSKILILGTMPSPKSREAGFYYAHPQNRFWKVMAALTGEPIPMDNRGRTRFLLRHKIALWDVLQSCEMVGAEDGSIRNPVANDLSLVLRAGNIQAIATTGSKAASLYRQYCFPKTGIPALSLPSTSPANCRYSLETLVEKYRVLLNYIESEKGDF